MGKPGNHGDLMVWLADKLLGQTEASAAPLAELPPKADMCILLFNPVYKFIFIKNTKVAGTSVAKSLGRSCPPGLSVEEMRVRPEQLMPRDATPPHLLSCIQLLFAVPTASHMLTLAC